MLFLPKEPIVALVLGSLFLNSVRLVFFCMHPVGKFSPIHISRFKIHTMKLGLKA